MQIQPQDDGTPANQTPSNVLPTLYDGWEALTPYVRYGRANKKRAPTLHRVDEPIPENASTVGPVYYLTPDQVERHEALREEPYRVAGSKKASIASVLTEEADKAERALYPVHVESDSLEEVGDLALMLEELARFVEEYLHVEPSECTYWYSGSRSIHVHVPRLVTGEELGAIKETAERFNVEGSTGVEVDPAIYKPKSQFRLPGAEHAKTGMYKVRVEPGMSHTEIVREATQVKEQPATYVGALRLCMSSTVSSTTIHSPRPHTHSISAGDVGRRLDGPDYEGQPQREYLNGFVEPGVADQPWRPSSLPAAEVWDAYNAREFSPYANTGTHGGRSVAVVRVRGGTFSSRLYDRPKDPEWRETPQGGRLPCYIYHATGGDGEYTKADEYAPLRLSRKDYDKVDGSNPGDHLIFIGGRSRSSRVLRVGLGEALDAATLLNDQGRETALSYLRNAGYEIGSAGRHGGRRRASEARGEPRPSGESNASRLQRKAETDGVETLSHTERFQVANRLLKIGGWSLAWEWFNERFGEDFKPDLTYHHLRSIVETYDDLDHVTVPEVADD